MMNKLLRKIFYNSWDMIRPIWIIISLIFGIVLSIVLYNVVINKLTVPANIIKIEQLRSDIQKPSHGDLESIISIAIKTNMKIKEIKYYNTQWWSCLVIPNEWDNVQLIEIPRKNNE